MPPSTKKLVRNLDLAIPAATFQVGGSIPLASPVTLFFQGEDACGSVRLPCSSADYATPGFQALLNACSPAKFGRGDKSVLDPQYRKALCLPADKLALNAALPLEDITQTVHRLLQPAAGKVVAELYKLNIYGPDGFFRSHVDTPRGPSMFGSLVICLPTDFTGGELVVNGPGGTNSSFTYSWGGSASAEGLQWAAFYSDLEHEIKPVTAGYRITLTYNLHQVNNTAGGAAPTPPVVDIVHQTAFGRSIQEGLKSKGWHAKGATLGFALEHQYTTDAKPPTRLDASMLKGHDLILYQTAAGLGLQARVVPLIKTPGQQKMDWGCESDGGGDSQPASESDDDNMEAKPDAQPQGQGDDDDAGAAETKLLLGEGFDRLPKLKQLEAKSNSYEDPKVPGLVWNDDDENEEEFLAARHGAAAAEGVVWVKPPTKQHWCYKDEVGGWGNEPFDATWYVAAALLVEVPRFGCGVRSA